MASWENYGSEGSAFESRRLHSLLQQLTENSNGGCPKAKCPNKHSKTPFSLPPAGLLGTKLMAMRLDQKRSSCPALEGESRPSLR